MTIFQDKTHLFQAAMGICNLRHVDSEIKKRKLIVERYNENLSDVKGIRLVEPQDGVSSNYSYFPVLFETRSRNEVYKALKANNIFAR